MDLQSPPEPGLFILCCTKTMICRYKWAHEYGGHQPPLLLLCGTIRTLFGGHLPELRRMVALGESTSGLCIVMHSAWLLYCMVHGLQVPWLLFEADPVVSQHQPVLCPCSLVANAKILFIIIFWGSFLSLEKQFWGCCWTATCIIFTFVTSQCSSPSSTSAFQINFLFFSSKIMDHPIRSARESEFNSSVTLWRDKALQRHLLEKGYSWAHPEPFIFCPVENEEGGEVRAAWQIIYLIKCF